MKKFCFALRKPNYTNGITRVVINLANELSKENNYEITILSMKEIVDKSVFNEKICENVKIKSLGLPYNSNKSILITAIPKLIKFFNSNQYDKVVISAMESVIPYFVGYYLSKNRTTKMAAWEHRNFLAGPFMRLEWIGKRIAIKYFSDVITITKKDYSLYLNYKNSKKIHQIYNFGNYQNIIKNYNTKSKKIISVGYLSSIKGYDMLIEVAQIVFKVHPDWIWDVYGEGSDRHKLEEEIENRNLKNNVFLKGEEENINCIYHQYALFVFTSRAEGMGMVLIEAEKAGLPVVSFDILCGPSDVVTDGVNGYLIKPFDIDEMAKKIINLIENAEIRQHFSEKSQSNHYEMERNFIINKWKKILED